ncbi:hypothetical protein Hanom_Chr12g01068371 [Helianthus anomalus]
MTKRPLPGGCGGDHSPLGDEKSTGGCSLPVILHQRFIWYAVHRPAPSHRSQHHPTYIPHKASVSQSVNMFLKLTH